MRFLPLLISFIFLAACNNEQKSENGDQTENTQTNPTPETTTDHSGITSILTNYYALKDALVEADTGAANLATQKLILSANSLDLANSGWDSTIKNTLNTYKGNIMAEANGLIGETDLTEKRRAFNMIGENLLPMLRASNYHGQKVYQQLCPMAFNESETATWLSNSREIVNPYLGKKHPKYASGMLHCGELKDSVGIHP